MTVQAITYRGRTVTACTPRRFFLGDELERRAPDDPERTFVAFMCAFAHDVAHGVLPGPYRDEDARRFARACLIPTELLERDPLDVMRAANGLRFPTSSASPRPSVA